MKLYHSPTSPFGRKIRIAAFFLGLDFEIELCGVDVMKDENFHRVNPLEKIPALITREGQVLTNSPFILEYLDFLSLGRKIIPRPGPRRWPALQAESIADGLIEASVSRRYESLRSPDKRDEAYDSRQKNKVRHALEFFESRAFDLKNDWEVGEITLACALGYLDFRFAHENWLKGFPRLKAWNEAARETAFMKKTSPVAP